MISEILDYMYDMDLCHGSDGPRFARQKIEFIGKPTGNATIA